MIKDRTNKGQQTMNHKGQTQINPYAETRNRSYKVRVKRHDRVAFIQNHAGFPEGTTAVVISESNAGFRGIEAYVAVEETGQRVHVSTGKLEII